MPTQRHPVLRLAGRLYDNPAQIPFQCEVYDHIAAGRSVVLQAPTGAGKTFAALAPFVLGAWGAGSGPPARKLIYSLPLRVLAGSLRQQYQTALIEKAGLDDLRFTNQYSGAAEDPFLDGGDDYWLPEHGNVRPGMRHAVFTTIDQTLSGFIGAPLGLPYRLANALYGSILSGALVFDEFHLLESDKSFRTALHLLTQSPWPVLVMTATMSTKLRHELCDILNAVPVTIGAEDLPHIRSQHETLKHVEVESEPMDGKVLAKRLGKRTLIICNRVKRAQQVYRELCQELGAEMADRRLLLHSRFLTEHRDAKEKKVLKWFAEDATEPAVVVATQVVEAGLDISCDVMHTEASPIDSFLQRIGRAARFGNQQEAKIFVYPVPDHDKASAVKPYSKETVDATLDQLRDRSALEYEHLQDLIDDVLEDEQAKWIGDFWSTRRDYQNTFHSLRQAPVQTANKEFVRHIDNVDVIVSPCFEVERRNVSPYAHPAVSISTNTLRGFFSDDGQAWGVREYTDEAGQAQRGQRYFLLEPVARDGSEISEYRRFVIEPQEATYSEAFGLELGKEGEVPFPLSDEVPSWTRYEYEEESYEEHIRRVYEQREVRNASMDALSRLSVVKDPGVLTDLVIWAHDIAKLADGWQAAHGNQMPPLAHGGRVHSPPPHAAESAWVAFKLVPGVLGARDEDVRTVGPVVLRAIRTHHSPTAGSLKAYRIAPERQAYLREVTEQLPTSLQSELEAHWSRLIWSRPHDEESPGWPPSRSDPRVDGVYALLVYMLRRSDGLGTSIVSKSHEYPAPLTKPAAVGGCL